MSLKEDMNNPLEPLKVEQALRSEQMKLEYRQTNKPNEINILDYTVIAALEKQIPKKPKKLTYKPLLDFGWRYECPNCKCACGESIYHEAVTSDQIFCTQCGQALDWEE
jgi:hypothetical protein